MSPKSSRPDDKVDKAETAAPSGAALGDLDHSLHGRAEVRRVGRWRFPVYELTQDNGNVVAQMGRSGWFKIYFGSGQRIVLADGTRWRVRSVGVAGSICPIVVDSERRKVAIAGTGAGVYGINTEHLACVFYPADSRRRSRRTWRLRHFEDELATVTRRPLAVDAARPVPIGVLLLCFVLARYGTPAEAAPTIPSFTWGKS